MTLAEQGKGRSQDILVQHDEGTAYSPVQECPTSNLLAETRAQPSMHTED